MLERKEQGKAHNEETGSLDGILSVRENEFLVRNLSTKTAIGLDGTDGKFYQRFKEEVIPSLYTFSQKAKENGQFQTHSVWPVFQFSSVTQSCLTLCNPMDRSMPGFPVLHQLPELSKIHIHRVSDTIQPSHPLSSLSPPTFNPSQHHGIFKKSVLRIRWPKYWSFSFSISPSNEYS